MAAYRCKPISVFGPKVVPTCRGGQHTVSEHRSRELSPSWSDCRSPAGDRARSPPISSAPSRPAPIARATGCRPSGNWPPRFRPRAAPCAARSTSSRRRASCRAGSAAAPLSARRQQPTASADLADQVSPIQLIEARLAVEPFTTRLAVLHATRRNLDDMETGAGACRGVGQRQGRLLQVGRRVPSPDRACLGQPAAHQCLSADQPCAAACAMGRDEGEDPDARSGRRLQPSASRHLQRAATSATRNARKR